MKKDIEFPVAKDVHLAVAREWDKDFLEQHWTAFLINDRPDALEMVMVVSKGYHEEVRTSTMRHALAEVKPGTYARIEMMQEEVLKLTNEFFVTFFAEGKLFERKFLFDPHSISEQKAQPIPILDKEGVLGR